MNKVTTGYNSSDLGSRLSPVLTVCAILFVILFVSACTTDEDRIRDANQDAASQVTTEQVKETGTISIFDIRPGDCFDEATSSASVGEFVEIDDVELKPCSGNWQFRVLDIFQTNQSGEFPGDLVFFNEASIRCPREWDFYYGPSSESWGAGDRVITCMEER